MCRSVRVIFDSKHCVGSRRLPFVIHRPDPPSMAASAMAHCDLAAIVASAFALSDLGKGERTEGPAFP